jgi:GGDEF domain-containing protein
VGRRAVHGALRGLLLRRLPGLARAVVQGTSALPGRLRALAGPEDVAARLGGDEFVLLVRPVDRRRLAALAAAVEEVVRRPFAVGGHAVRGSPASASSSGTVHLGVSVGTALGWPGATPDELVAEADREMYAVKSRRSPRPRARSTPRTA